MDVKRYYNAESGFMAEYKDGDWVSFEDYVKLQRANNPAVAAIGYALQNDEPETFLRLWFAGEFDALRKEWESIPDEVFLGADPLFKIEVDKALDFNASQDNQNERMLREALQKLVQAVGGKLEADDKFKRCVSEARAALFATEPSPTL